MKNYAIIAPRIHDFWNWVDKNIGIYVKSDFARNAVETDKAIYFYTSALHGAERLKGLIDLNIILAGNYETKPPNNLKDFEHVARTSKR